MAPECRSSSDRSKGGSPSGDSGGHDRTMPPPVTARPATTSDAATAGFPDLLPDRWRAGDNRRSFVAVDAGSRVLGHCRGIDNVFHPASRTLVLETAPLDDARSEQVEDVLVAAQIDASALPLHAKPEEGSTLVDLCRRHGGVLIQLMPPWRCTVDPSLRAWAAARPAGDELRAGPLGQASPEAVLDLHVEHYRAQHATWSPAAPASQLRHLNAPDITGGSADGLDPDLSTVLVRDGELCAQALVWPAEQDGAREVSLQCREPGAPASRAEMEACLAAVIDQVPDGTVLLIDSHVTEPVESAMMRDLRAEHPVLGPWSAIVAIPVPGGPAPIPLPAASVPAEAEALVRALGRP